MSIKNEILNIEYNTIRILVKVINRSRTLEDVAYVTKIDYSTIFKLLRKYDIKYKKKLDGNLKVTEVGPFQYTDHEGPKVVEIPIV